MAKGVTVTLPFKKETKNMIQFQADPDDKKAAAVPTLYVSKESFPGELPSAIKVTVEAIK